MKALILSLLLIVSFLTLQSYETQDRQISGQVVDVDNIPLIGANVIIKGTSEGTFTDIEGKFVINMPEGYTILLVSLTGYDSKEINVETDDLKIVLEQGHLLEEVMFTKRSFFDKVTSFASKRKESKVSPHHMMDVAMSAAPLSYSTTAIASSVSPTHTNLPSAGQITAGEWNDLNNWEDWNTLIKEDDYKSMSQHWNIFPDERYSVFVTNEENFPVINAKVELLSKSNQVIWSTMTDNTGKAELWNSINSEKQLVDKIRISKNRQIEYSKKPVLIHQGSNHLTLDLPCSEQRSVDIAFIVDATGSMGDEITFLRSELTDIIGRLEIENPKTSYRTASIFYKDKNEDYLTSTSELSKDISTTVEFIKTKSAGGGGDYEEAVEEGIKEALALEWNPDAVARLAFLVLDAPPHHTPEIIETLRNQLTHAAAQGIKLIPITASGINRETEFLMKYFSIITNGTYVFITDDSGIGNGHLDPVVDDYEVEKLNDLIVRLVKSFGHLSSCLTDKANHEISVKIFPNPASEYVNIELNHKADKIILRSSSGKIVMQINDPKKGVNKIRLDNFVGGMYTVQIEKDKEIIASNSVIVIN